jgi:hypothetical protein
MTPADRPSHPTNGLKPAARRTAGRWAMIIIPLCAAIGLGGCQTVKWSKPGGTEAMFQTDQYQCVQESISQLPPAYTTQYPTYQGYSSQSKCKPKSGGYQCNYSSNSYNPGPSVVDANSDIRNQVIQSCLMAKGWQKFLVPTNQSK